jgi:hypothetical protein
VSVVRYPPPRRRARDRCKRFDATVRLIVFQEGTGHVSDAGQQEPDRNDRQADSPAPHRPGDVERVRAMGLAAWIERQLEPERIPDELVERRLGAYPTLRMTTAELFQEFPRPDPSASTRRRGRCAAARRRSGTGGRARRGSA